MRWTIPSRQRSINTFFRNYPGSPLRFSACKKPRRKVKNIESNNKIYSRELPILRRETAAESVMCIHRRHLSGALAFSGRFRRTRTAVPGFSRGGMKMNKAVAVMRTFTILIVEDNGLIAFMLQRLFAEYGYTVPAPVASGEDALEYVRANPPPDLIVMDIALDGLLDGIETARLIQETGDIPVIFISGIDQETAFTAGGPSNEGFIGKPFVASEVLLTVEKMARLRTGSA